MYDVSLLESNRSFRIYWAVEAAATLARGLNSVALPWFVLTFTGSPLQLGLAFALRSAPDVVVSPIIGGLIDRRSRSRLMAIGQLSTAVITAALPALFLVDRLALRHVYLGMLGLSVTRSLSHNASRAALPTIVDEARLDEANALLMGVRSGGQVVFLLVGGGLTVALGPATTLFGAATGSIVAGGLLVASSVETGRVESDGGLRAYVDDFRSGVRTLRSSAVLVQLLGFGIAYNFFVVPYGSVLLPAVARDGFESAGALTVLLAGWRGGAVVGNAVAGRVTAPPSTKMVAGVAVVGAGTVLAGIAMALDVPSAFAGPTGSRVLVGAAGLFVAGVGQPLFDVTGSTLLQRIAPDESRGTIVTVQNSVLQASFPVPLLLAGKLLAAFSTTTLLGAAGVGLLALACLIAARFENTGSRRPSGTAQARNRER